MNEDLAKSHICSLPPEKNPKKDGYFMFFCDHPERKLEILSEDRSFPKIQYHFFT